MTRDVTAGQAALDRRCPWCGEPALVRDGDDERCTTDGCRYGVQGKFRDE